MPSVPMNTCTDATLGQALTPYCFGDLTDAERETVEQHLLECDACWSELARLEQAVRALRLDDTLQPTVPPQEIVSLMGLSSRLHRLWGGHQGFALASAAGLGLLFAVPVVVEIAYDFDRFGALALRLGAATWVWVFTMTLGILWFDVRMVRAGRSSAGRVVLALGVATLLLCAVLLPFLPSASSVRATFETYPVQLGYLKSVFYAWMVAPVFVFLPFHFVVCAQRELVSGRYVPLLALLTRDGRGLPPRGAFYPRVWALAIYLAVIVGLNYFGVNHLFESLEAGTYRTLFMGLVLFRVSIWIGLAVLGLWWYASALTELKREALALQTLSGSFASGRPPT
ncbi:MAG TPA: zf-HC2 domain-containing protein [Vicinamibacterales bacterium]|nr:zf-HC2 domain-containing protein [Vicinamibacterales bacterium]